MPRPRALVWGAVIALAVSARFVFETALVGAIPAPVTVAATVVPAALALALVALRLPAQARLDRRDMLLAGVAGVLGVWLAPLLVAASRASDAPSGSEVLFLTTSGFGVVLVAAGLIAARRFDSARLTGALLGLVGAAGVLANWERPSSFSPFLKFPGRESAMLLGGVVFAIAVCLLADVVRRRGPLAAVRTAALAGAAASVAGAAVLAPQALSAFGLAELWTFAVPAAVATFTLLLAWAQGLGSAGVESLAAAYLLPPVLLTGLSFVEKRVGMLGPDPIRWHAAAPALVLAAAAACLVAFASKERGSGEREGAGMLLLAARAVAVLSALLALAGLVRPDLAVSVRGLLSSGESFHTEFTMAGAETVGGWLAACCTLLAAGMAWRPAATVRQQVLRACVLGVALTVWLPVHTTPTHVWSRWIPPEVQQDYGTEFAKRTEQPLVNPWEIAALAGAGLTATLVLLRPRRGAAAAAKAQEVPTA